MAAGKEDIRAWFEEGVADGMKYMLVVYDRMGGPDDFDSPYYYQTAKEAQKAYARLSGESLYEVMEAYDLSMNIEIQLAEKRAWHLPGQDSKNKEMGSTNYSYALMMLDGTWPLFEDGDDPKALATHQLEEAVKRGHAQAALRLGSMCATGDGVDKDLARAYELFENAAKNGLAEAYELLCLFSWRGLGVAQDTVQAVRWANQAAANRAYCLEKAVSIRNDHNKAAESILGYVCLINTSKWNNWAAPLIDRLFTDGKMPVSREEAERLLTEAW